MEEYYTLRESTQAMSQFYESELKVKDELTTKMQECEGEQREVMAKI